MATEPTIFELSSPGRRGVTFPEPDVPDAEIPASFRRESLAFPEASEIDVVRHFTRMSQKNHAIDISMYPLGSCTMKFNPRINEAVARMPGYAALHPLQRQETAQGALQLMYELQEMLAEISGFAAVSLQPAAGAHGELAGTLIIREFHRASGDTARTEMLVPDSAHGTNPATAVMAGFSVVTIPSDDRGNVDLAALREKVGPNTAGMMITNPNTLGLWDEHIHEVVDIVHAAGGLIYNDGANFNAILGLAKPGRLGVDVMHYNLHKTFSTPHGGGGPGSGPIGVTEALRPYLPGPVVSKSENANGETVYSWESPEKSIGRLHGFHGNFGMHVRAYTYIRMHGAEGLKQISEDAVLNANYLKARLEDTYDVAYDRPCMHEVVLSASKQKQQGARALDIAKRLLDFGVHPPTTYFPLIVPEALMIEPTETESKQSIDYFADTMLTIAREIEETPDVVTGAPHTTDFKRLDEAGANRSLNLRWTEAKEPEPVAAG
ncbi:MAG: aminomethyl-transferring glycine dehydrogenase subunit GcvPB [Thermomicrobiales bacterium]|jgi:glycine dehydrogenase subunit 2|nr:aminomethyl-transferring glycine dehydrogenase subunit GcvPB [Thermomicrobiales bacterium]